MTPANEDFASVQSSRVKTDMKSFRDGVLDCRATMSELTSWSNVFLTSRHAEQNLTLDLPPSKPAVSIVVKLCFQDLDDWPRAENRVTSPTKTLPLGGPVREI